MNAKEFVSRLAPVDLPRLALIFDYLADRQHELRLADGQPLNDGLDFSAFHRELAAACKMAEDTKVQSEAVSRTRPPVTTVCMRCFHRHEKDDECGVDLGKGGRCDCRAEVTA